MKKLQPTIAGIEEEVRLMILDGQEPDLPGMPPKQFLSINEWISHRMREAALAALTPKEPQP